MFLDRRDFLIRAVVTVPSVGFFAKIRNSIFPQETSTDYEASLTPDLNLLLGISQNDCALMATALKAGADPNYYDGEVADENTEFVRNWSALTFAVSRDRIEVIEFLLKSGAKTDLYERTAGAPLAFAKSIAVAKLLLQYSANPNGTCPAYDEQANTKGHCSVAYELLLKKRFKIFDYLVKNGADLDAPNVFGTTMVKHITSNMGRDPVLIDRLTFYLTRTERPEF